MSNFFINPSWFNQGSSFRYLQDEITGVTLAYSNLRTDSSVVNSYEMQGNEVFGFSDNFVDLNAMQVFYGVDATVLTRYNQSSGGNNATGVGIYDNSENDIPSTTGVHNLNYYSGTGVDYDSPFTMVFSWRQTSNVPSGTGRTICDIGTTSNGIDIRMQSTRCQVILGTQTSQLIRTRHNLTYNFNGADEQILMITYDGSRDASGVDVYYNDVTNALPRSIVNNNLGALVFNVTDINLTGLDFSHEIFFCNSVLDSSSRNTFKDILAQKYTYI